MPKPSFFKMNLVNDNYNGQYQFGTNETPPHVEPSIHTEMKRNLTSFFEGVFAERKHHLEETCIGKGLTSKTLEEDSEHQETTQLVFYNLYEYDTILCV